MTITIDSVLSAYSVEINLMVRGCNQTDSLKTLEAIERRFYGAHDLLERIGLEAQDGKERAAFNAQFQTDSGRFYIARDEAEARISKKAEELP